MSQVVLATRNAHKAEELARILESLNVDVTLKLVSDFPDVPEVPETESTFEGNARLKAKALVEATGLPAIADDSGICVHALNDMPGVLSARWAGVSENADQANLSLVLKQIEDVPDARRGAQFVCAAVLVMPDGREFVTRGTVDGFVLRAPQGSHGFGYDPIFQPEGFDKTTAEMTAAEKDAISHRGQAMRELARVMQEIF